MSDDSRHGRRVGDETMQRIDELADGWAGSKPAGAAPDAAHKPDASGSRAPVPPGPPTVVVSSTAAQPQPAERARRSSGPPPPPGRKKVTSAPPPRLPSDDLPTVKQASLAERDPPAAASPPRSQAASRPPPIPTRPPPVPRGPAPPERAEPTMLSSTEAAPRPTGRAKVGTGTLRIPVGLPRRRGFLGDIVYVYTAAFGVAGARRELAAIGKRMEAARTQRDERVLELARAAIGDDDLRLAAVDRARDELVAIEEARSARSGAVAAADEEILVLRRDRERESTEHKAALAALAAELTKVSGGLEPLDKKMHGARRRAFRLRSQLGALDSDIAREENSLVAVASGGKVDAATVEANIATLRAERETVAAEEPPLADEIDDLEPKIAALDAARGDVSKKVADLEEREREAQVRCDEMIAAVIARKAVEERAVSDLARAREQAIRGLGEQLVTERPPVLIDRCRPVDQADLRLAELDRRGFELAELVSGINRAALWRGIGWIALLLGGAAGLLLAYLTWIR